MGGPLEWGVIREKEISGSSCIAEIKAVDEGVKAMQHTRHLMKELEMEEGNSTTPLLNDNKGAIDWIHNGCKISERTRHENIRELRVVEKKLSEDVDVRWVASKQNQADLFTKEHTDKSHYKCLRDLTVCPRESAYAIMEGAAEDDATAIASNRSDAVDDFELIDEFDPEPIKENSWAEVVKNGKKNIAKGHSNVGMIMKAVARMGGARRHVEGLGVRPSTAPPRIVPGL